VAFVFKEVVLAVGRFTPLARNAKYAPPRWFNL
jgi:hypothetical protein